jgi:dimeric dUTPase (all-alpha-NTP-PPase superfamily)
MNLEKLYKMQEELDKYIIKNRNIVMSEAELLDKE